MITAGVIDTLAPMANIDELYFCLPTSTNNASFPVPSSIQTVNIHNSNNTTPHLLSFLAQSNNNALSNLVLSILPKPKKLDSLYAELTNVLTALKSYKDYVDPFLQKVTRKEAPNYFNVIKTPMDLGTIAKKLKSKNYKSKMDFKKDLDLVWENCLTFNTAPESVYRKKAIFLRERAEELMSRVTEVDFMNQDDGDDDSGDEFMFQELDEEVDAQLQDSNNNTVAAMSKASTSAVPSQESPAKDPNKRDSTSPSKDESKSSDPQYDDEESNQYEDEYVSKWKEYINNNQIIQKRMNSLALPFPDRPTLNLTPSDTEGYFELLGKYLIRINKIDEALISNGTNGAMEITSSNASGDQDAVQTGNVNGNTEPQWFFPEYLNASVPRLKLDKVKVAGDVVESEKLFDYYWTSKLKTPSASDFKQSQPNRKSVLNTVIDKNIQEMKIIKDIRWKILAREAGIDEEYPSPPTPPVYKPKRKSKKEIDFVTNKVLSESILRQCICKLLKHVGFDSAQQSTMDTLAELLIQYLQNLGKTFRMYSDKFGHDKSGEEILIHTFLENGVPSIKTLDMYVKYDIKRYGVKLTELRKKMVFAYNDFVGQTGEQVVDAGFDVDENTEDLISGSYLDDLGVDILGLKDLGVGATSVPSELWNKKSDKVVKARVRRRILDREDNFGQSFSTPLPNEIKPETIPPWNPIDPMTQIGLLRDFYFKKFEENDLLEDDQKQKTRPSKSKQNLKQAMIRKRQVTTDENLTMTPSSAAKKKKKVAGQVTTPTPSGVGTSTASTPTNTPFLGVSGNGPMLGSAAMFSGGLTGTMQMGVGSPGVGKRS
ncbi:Transcriptional activator spt7 [Nowakowskiella sp. JEL0407]|nr:Transcriptional activator spt7 [Nowakowskiella sp. JEL0407]